MRALNRTLACIIATWRVPHVAAYSFVHDMQAATYGTRHVAIMQARVRFNARIRRFIDFFLQSIVVVE